jgi:hypothetical protein
VMPAPFQRVLTLDNGVKVCCEQATSVQVFDVFF